MKLNKEVKAICDKCGTTMGACAFRHDNGYCDRIIDIQLLTKPLYQEAKKIAKWSKLCK